MKSEDIAKLAGVSRSTVSRVMNNYPNVPDETREKVMKIVNEHNYMPNSCARTLAGKNSNTIGLFFVIHGGRKDSDRLFRNEYFTTYLDAIVDMANAKDYYVLVSIVSDENKYLNINRAFLEKRIDGGIIIGTQNDTLSRFDAEKLNTSIVLFDYKMSDEELIKYKNNNFTIINSKDKLGIEKAVDYLYNLGHREIGFIKGNENSMSGRARYNGFVESMKKRDMDINEDYVLHGDFSAESAYSEVNRTIKNNKIASAYISGNDSMALGAIRAFKEKGYSIPGDVSIIGFDNIQGAQELDVKLTTIGSDFYRMAKKAISILDSQIKNENKNNDLQVLEYDVKFFERDTCKKI
ncbi:MAG: LacI family DNA-binding transcriptional regulator [Clostridiaceae bacterium]